MKYVMVQNCAVAEKVDTIRRACIYALNFKIAIAIDWLSTFPALKTITTSERLRVLGFAKSNASLAQKCDGYSHRKLDYLTCIAAPLSHFFPLAGSILPDTDVVGISG